MDVTAYRNNGELSDITVTVDGQEFNLHKFPLFVRSNYFKNLSSSKKDSKVTLENFPGGARTFATIADYCYDKEIKVSQDNVVSVKLAAEYLDMHGKNTNSKSGLASAADNTLYDVMISAKARRDYATSLKLLDQACDHADLTEQASGLEGKLIDSFAENLAGFTNGAAFYEPSFTYDNRSSMLSPSSKKPINHLALNQEQLSVLNNLPLKWMNKLVKACARNNVHDSLISHMIKNYIDFNTDLNPNYLKEQEEQKPRDNKNEEKPSNLISMAADILKVDRKLADITASKSGDDDEKDEKAATNLIDIMKNVIGKDKEENKEDAKEKVVAAIDEKLKNLSSSSSSSSDDEDSEKPKPFNLINIMTDLINKDDASGEENKNHSAQALIDAATDAFDKKARRVAPRTDLSDKEKAKVISTLTNTVDETKVEPDFPLAWLLTYANAIDDLDDVDDDVKSNFHKWSLNALRNSNDKSEFGNLDAIPPAAMIKLIDEIISKQEGKPSNSDNAKIINLTESYMTDLNKQNKLDPETFIKLAQVVPKEKRQSFDNLAIILSNLLEKNDKISESKKEEMLDLIDFHKLNEATLDECNKNKKMPTQKINEAALALCAKLRKELDDAKLLIKSYETRGAPSASSYSNHHHHAGSTSAFDSPSYNTSTPYNTSRYNGSSNNYSSTATRPYTSSYQFKNYGSSSRPTSTYTPPKSTSFQNTNGNSSSSLSKAIPIQIHKSSNNDRTSVSVTNLPSNLGTSNSSASNGGHRHHHYHQLDDGTTCSTVVDYSSDCDTAGGGSGAVIADIVNSTNILDDSDLADCYDSATYNEKYNFITSTYTKIY